MNMTNKGIQNNHLTLTFFALITACMVCHNTSSAQSGYTWKSVIAGGGGFVPGIVYHPTAQGLAYARTDMGGAYRWDNSAGKWVPLTDMMNRNNSDYMGILSIGLDRNDTNRIYMECGKYTQSWAGTGAVLSSTDKGNSWIIHSLTVKIGGNEDGRGAGERLQVDPNVDSILFMGTTANGLWKSTNYASTWTKVTSFLPTNVNFVIFDPTSVSPGNATQRIFVAVVDTSGQSLYRSDNGGSSWTVVPGQLHKVMAIRADIADTLLYITFANYQGPNSATTGSVWKYGIPSGTWTNISPSSGSYGFSGISVYPKNPNIIIVSTLDRWSPRDEVYLTINGGTSWTARLTNATLEYSYAPYVRTNTPHWLAALVMDPFDSSKAMFGTGYGIWACDNLSSSTPTWHFRDENLEETVATQIISPPFTNLLSVMGDVGGFRHDNLDVSPPDRFNPIKWTTGSIAFAGKVTSKIVQAYNSPTPFGSYSNDGGTTWRDFPKCPTGATNGGSWAIAVSADGSSIVWGPTGSSLSYSINNGKTWTTCGGTVPRVPPVADRINPNKFYVYASTAGKMWLSTDGGKTFIQGVTGLPTVPDYSSADGNITAVPGYEGNLWICCGSGGLYRSANSGGSVAKVSTVTAAYRIGFGKALIVGSYPAIYLFGTVGGVLGFFRSDDIGASWTRINDDNHQFGWIHQITGDPRVYGRCYISAEGRGIVYGQPVNSDTTNNPSSFRFLTIPSDSLRQTVQSITVSWSRASDPQSSPLTYSLHFFGSSVDTTFSTADTTATFYPGNIQPSSSYVLTGYVTNGYDTTATSNSIFFSTASIVTDVEEASARVPMSYTLYQNYPNPFNPQTTISYLLPRASTVTLKVYDLIGREVAILMQNERKVPGNYKISFDASNLSSGVYFYKLQTKRFIKTKQMVLVK
jgi:hypothetical protein